MANIIVGISDMACSGEPADVLVTHSLGSCLGVAFYDKAQHVGGLLHCMLPLSKSDTSRAASTPAMFVDSGVTTLLTEMFKRGCTRKNIVTKVAGGACLLNRQDLFRIGERNYTVLRKVLWKNNMLIDAEDVGGNASRTVRLEIATGRFLVKSASGEVEL